MTTKKNINIWTAINVAILLFVMIIAIMEKNWHLFLAMIVVMAFAITNYEKSILLMHFKRLCYDQQSVLERQRVYIEQLQLRINQKNRLLKRYQSTDKHEEDPPQK